MKNKTSLPYSWGSRARVLVWGLLALTIPTVSRASIHQLADLNLLPPTAANLHMTPSFVERPSAHLLPVRLVLSCSNYRKKRASKGNGLDFGAAPQTKPVLIGLTAAGVILLPFGEIIRNWSVSHWQGSFWHQAAQFGNTVGSTGGIAALLATYTFGKHYDRRTSIIAMSAVADAFLTTYAIKLVAGANRPDTGDDEVFRGPLRGTSFPSGHTSFAFAMATVYGARYPHAKWLFYALASWVGLSRIESNHHFLSDVLVGAGIGINSGQMALDGRFNMLRWRF